MGEREEGERQKSNSKTVILKDSCIKSVLNYLTAILAMLQTQTDKHDYT